MSTFHKIHTEFLHIGSDIIMDNNAESVSDHISDINKHRIINDSSVSGTELLSASKITSLVSDVNGTVNTHINDLSVHRIINDLSVSVTELLSASKIISLANLKEDLSNKNAPSGYAGLTGSGMIPNNLLPPLAITKPALYISIAARDADIANAQEGDVAIVTDVQKSYIYSGVAYIELVTTGSIASINGLVGAAIQINTEHVPEITNLYYTEARVSANTDVVDNTNRIVELENKQAVWYESSSSEICTEVFPSDVTEISSISQGTSFTPIIAGTYRVTFNAQFEMTKGIKINIRTTTAIIALKAQLNALTYTSHGDVYGSETLFAGNYYIAGATTHTGILTFDAQDDPNATFVIKCGAAHAIGVGATNILINGAKASNIFYYVIGALSAGVNADVVGTFIGDAAVGIGVGCTLTGRLFTTLGAITTGNIMGLPTETDSHPFDLGIASQYVLFSISGNISNPSVITNPATITSGNVACGTGTVVNFPPYDGIYNTDESDVVMRIVFGIYNDNVLSNSSLTYVENKTAGKYYSVAMSTTIVNNGELISARIGVDSDSGTAIVTNRTLYGVRQI